MAMTGELSTRQSLGAEDDLTDEQIEELLAGATARLEAKSKAVQIQEPTKYNFPKLNTGKLEKPYISSDGVGAHVDAGRLLEEKHRKQANGTRTVEDPVAAKKLAIEVSNTIFSFCPFVYEENIPNFLISSGFWTPFWLFCRTTESLFFIVTLRHFTQS